MATQVNTTLYLLTGPTAVGKTELAIRWAQALEAEILSCDSLLFYRGMNIGTAKPDAVQLDAVAHHGIDLAEVSDQFNIGRYLDYAESVVNQLHQKGKSVLVTGGSGFYLKGFVAPVVDSIIIPQEIDHAVDAYFESEGLQGLLERLQKASPNDWNSIDIDNPRRVIPALKRCLASGLSLSELKARMQQAPYPFERFAKKSVLLHRSPDALLKRIEQRTQQMLTDGLVDEVKALLDSGIESNPSASQSIGYREVIQMLNGEISESQLGQEISKNTVKLVKKQMKWFKHQMHFDQKIDLENFVFEGEEIIPKALL